MIFLQILGCIALTLYSVDTSLKIFWKIGRKNKDNLNHYIW